MKYIKLEFNQSYEHASFLEEQSMGWLKYHFAFFPITLIILKWLLTTETTTIDQALFIKYGAIALLAILLLVGLCNLYNQTTARIGYTTHTKNINSIYDKFSTDSYISKIRNVHPFWKGDTTRYFYIWDFWSTHIILISIVNALALLILINIFYLNYEIQGGQVVLRWSPNIATHIVINGAFAILQFSVYAFILHRLDRKC